MSSLQQQLSKLSTETISYSSTGSRRNVPSLLYGDSAKSIPIDTVHEIALAALTEIQSIDPAFRVFRDTIFHPNAAKYDRESHTAEHNLQFIDTPMNSFLDLVIPYLHLPASHRAIEFLIRRFRADLKCVNQLVMSFLPYHETVIFGYLISCLNNTHDPEKLSSSHILVLLGKDGWPGPRSTLMKQLRRNSYNLFAKVVSKTIDLEKVSPEACLFYMRFCFTIARDLLTFSAANQEQVLLREVFRLMTWAIGPKAHAECREAACFLLLTAPPSLLHGLANTKQGRGIMRLFLQHPVNKDRTMTLKILMSLSHDALENNVPTVLTLTDVLYGLCSDEWMKVFSNGVLLDLLRSSVERKTEDEYRSILISFTYLLADTLFRFTTVPWETPAVPEKDRPSLRTAFESGLQIIILAFRTVTTDDERKEKTLQAGLAKLIRHLTSSLVKYMLTNEKALPSNCRIQELARLSADISIASFASGSMQAIEESCIDAATGIKSAIDHVLTLLFEDYNQNYWMLTPIAAQSSLPCILALDSTSTELRLMGYEQIKTMMEDFASREPIDLDNLLKILFPLCTHLLSEGDPKILEVICDCIDQLIAYLPKRVPCALPAADIGTLLSTLTFFYKRLVATGMLYDVYLSTLSRLHKCLARIGKEEALDQDYIFLGRHLALLGDEKIETHNMSPEELVFPFGGMLAMLEAVQISISNRSVSKHTDLILRSIIKIDATIADGSKEQAALETLIKHVMSSPGYLQLLTSVVCMNITECSMFLLNTTIRHSTDSNVLTQIGMAYLVDKDISTWSVPLFKGSFDKALETCIFHNVFREKTWTTKAIEHAQTAPSGKQSRAPFSGPSKHSSKRESAVVQQPSADENNICDPDFLLACALCVFHDRSKHSSEFLEDVSGSLQLLSDGIGKTVYGTIFNALQTALTSDEEFDIVGTMAELLGLISGSTRVCHVYIAQFISCSLIVCTTRYVENKDTEPIEPLAGVLNDVVMFINNSQPDSSPTTLVLLGQALEQSVLLLVKELSHTDRAGLMLTTVEGGISDHLLSTFCERSAVEPEFLQKSLSGPADSDPIKSLLLTLAESSYIGIVAIADSLGDKELTLPELHLQQARLYSTLAVLGTVPEFVSISHDISSVAFLLLGAHEVSAFSAEQVKLYEDLASENVQYCLPISVTVTNEVRRLAAEYVSRAPLAVTYVAEYISMFPITFLESLTRRRGLVDKPNALLSILILQISDTSASIQAESRREALALRLVLRMISTSNFDRQESDYNEQSVYGELADAAADEDGSGEKETADKSLATLLATFDQLSCVIPSQVDAENLAGLCLYHPELLACAQSVLPDKFETLFVDRILERLFTEKHALKIAPDAVSQIIINLFQLTTRIYPLTPAFWDTAIKLVKSAVELTSLNLLTQLDQQRIFLAMLALADQTHHGIYCLMFVLANLKTFAGNGAAPKGPELKELQKELLDRFVTRMTAEYQLQALYLLCHGSVWKFLRTGHHDQTLLEVIETLSNTVSCVTPRHHLAESVTTMQSLGFSLLFGDIGSSVNMSRDDARKKRHEALLKYDQTDQDEQNEDTSFYEDDFLSTLLIHMIRTIWNVAPPQDATKKSKKKKGAEPENEQLASALANVQLSIDMMTTCLDNYAFYVSSWTDGSVLRYSTSCIIGAAILMLNDNERGQRLLERLVANLALTALATACAKLYSNVVSEASFQQPCTVLFRLLCQKVTNSINGRKIEHDDVKQAILILQDTFVSAVTDPISEDFKRLVSDSLINFAEEFPATMDSALSVEMVKTITASELYRSLPTAKQADSILHNNLRVLSHLVAACDTSILPILKDLLTPILEYVRARTSIAALSESLESYSPELFSETTLEVLILLSSVLSTQGRFITPYLSDVIINLSLLCPLGPCTESALGVPSTNPDSVDMDTKFTTIKKVFDALLPGVPVIAHRGVTETTVKILSLARDSISSISSFSSLRLLIPSMHSFLKSYLALVQNHGLHHVEPLVHVISLVLYQSVLSTAITSEYRNDILKFILIVLDIRSDHMCYPPLLPQYDRLETAAIYVIALLDLLMPDKPISGILERCWSWTMEASPATFTSGTDHTKTVTKQGFTVFDSLFEKTHREAVASIQLSSPPSIMRMTSYAHILAVLGGQDPDRLVSGVGKMLYEVIGTYLFAITNPQGCLSYNLDNKTIAKLLKGAADYKEIKNAPLGMLTTCGITTPSVLTSIDRNEFYEAFSIGRYFALFIFTCGNVVGTLKDDVYIAAVSFMVAILCSPASQCDDVRHAIYPTVDTALRAVSGSQNMAVLWEYIHEMCITLMKSSNDAFRLRGVELLEVFLTVTISQDIHWFTRTVGIIDEAIEDLDEKIGAAAQSLVSSIEGVTGKPYRNLIGISL